MYRMKPEELTEYLLPAWGEGEGEGEGGGAVVDLITVIWYEMIIIWDQNEWQGSTTAAYVYDKVPHNIESLRVSVEETFRLFETSRPEWASNPRSPTFKAGSLNYCTRAPPLH